MSAELRRRFELLDGSQALLIEKLDGIIAAQSKMLDMTIEHVRQTTQVAQELNRLVRVPKGEKV